jgi:hypothetical protein
LPAPSPLKFVFSWEKKLIASQDALAAARMSPCGNFL